MRFGLHCLHRKTQGQRIRRFYMKRVISKAQEMQMFKMQIVFFKMNGIGCLAMRLHASTRGNKSTILSSVQSTLRRFFFYLSGFLSAFLHFLFTWYVINRSKLVATQWPCFTACGCYQPGHTKTTQFTLGLDKRGVAAPAQDEECKTIT